MRAAPLYNMLNFVENLSELNENCQKLTFTYPDIPCQD